MTRYLASSGKSTALAIYHKQIGDLVLLESALRRLARATDSAVPDDARWPYRGPRLDYDRHPARESRARDTTIILESRVG
jgi:hypothetical protein